MQQRWPPSVHTEQHTRQKNGEVPRLIDMSPRSGNQGTIVTVVVQSLPHQVVPVKLAFNSLVVDTKQMQAQGITSLVAAVPPFHQTHSTTANVPISICILDKDSVTETWPVAEFAYEFENEDPTTTPTLTSASTNSSTEPLPIDYPNNEKRNDITPNHYTAREGTYIFVLVMFTKQTKTNFFSTIFTTKKKSFFIFLFSFLILLLIQKIFLEGLLTYHTKDFISNLSIVLIL